MSAEHPAAQDRLQASLDELSLGGNHPIQVIVPRADLREVLAENERLSEALNEIIDMPIDEAKSAGFHFAEVRRIAREAMRRET